MKDEIHIYLEKYNKDIQELFDKLRRLIIQSAPSELEEKMWAKLPSYYLNDNFIRVIPFKDHVNIEAKAIMEYSEQLKQYKITPKGMLQIYVNQEIPESVLKKVYSDTLMRD